MQRQVAGALEAIKDVLVQLRERIEEQGLEAEDMDPEKVLACPRTKVGDRLGRFIVNRLKVCICHMGGTGWSSIGNQYNEGA
jgi:hypothetical protein